MANVRCPMCSKINTPEAEVCAFCGARIKPLGPGSPTSGTGSPASASPAQPAKPSQGDDSDWLSSLRGSDPMDLENPTGSPPSEEEEQEDGDVPDWLSRIRTRAKTETGDLPGEEKEEQPDWMSDLQETESPTAKGPAGKPPQTPAAAPPVKPAEPEREDDWFARLGGKVETPEEHVEDIWASSASTWEDSQEPSTPAQGSEGFSWLDALSGESAEPESSVPDQAAETSGFGLTGFLKNVDEEPAAPFQPSTPDAEGFGDFFATPSDESLPGWLGSDFGAEETKPAAQSQEGEAALPDWLSGLGGQPAAAQEQEQPILPEEEAAFGALPAWLRGETEPPAAGPAAVPDAQSELPDWLSSLGSVETAASEPAAQEPAAQEPAAFQPEAGLPEADVPAEALSGFAFLDAQEGEKPEEEAAFPTAEQPDWLAGFQADISEQPAEPVEPEPAETANIPAPFIDEQAPAWLRDFGASQPVDTESGMPALIEMEAQAGPEAAAELPFATDLPDWLEKEGKAQEKETIQTPSTAEGPVEDLERAEIPGWLKPMRPFDTIATGEALATETDQRTEKAGPLSGLRGVLPVAENLFRYRKPPIYSSKLRVTEKQRTQASLLETILQQESQPLLVQPESVRAPRLILRLLIALALVFVLVIPSFPGINFPPLSTPVLYPAELLNMFQQIDKNLPQGQEATVLLAVDYEPGLSGEMQAAAAPVISHLMAKNVRLVIVSTTPSGPILADQLLRQAASSAPGYVLNELTVNLGYLPGGTISLLEFVRQPQLAAPASLSGQMAWQTTFLNTLSGFKDFAQVIVLTDTAETGRAWVEQVSPNMGNVPLFMVASAQAAPLLVPYLRDDTGNAQETGKRGGRIDGMVSGLLGGAQYGKVAQQANNPASQYWAAYQIGIVLAIVLILAGGLYSGVKRILGRDQKGEA